jgi:hypothetical protein
MSEHVSEVALPEAAWQAPAFAAVVVVQVAWLVLLALGLFTVVH